MFVLANDRIFLERKREPVRNSFSVDRRNLDVVEVHVTWLPFSAFDEWLYLAYGRYGVLELTLE
jgi:hypothetical protein